jgi:2-keto-4-pentenoate hydratase/2-oxohepta-3-ene-1,7-dioic acid hydratase in catechol pathway
MKIICIGRNYVNHAKELNNEVPEEPVFFIKPDTALLRNNSPFYLPPDNFLGDIHYEVELVLKINKAGKAIPEQFASTYYDFIGIGLDLTARQLQTELKKKGLPWEKAKAFDYSAPISMEFIPVAKLNIREGINFSLEKNGAIVQKGNTEDMIFSFDKIISYVSRYITLRTGDLIFTGTPQGVGEIEKGDLFRAYIENKLMLEMEVK